MPFPQSEIAKRRFVDVQLIGQGAFGNVYRATDQRLRRTVAVKEIAATLSPNDRQAAERRFETEAQIVARLASPQIVSVYGYDDDPQQGEQYLYLEYVGGGTLAAALVQGRLGEREALLVAHDVTRAVEAHWALGIVHRDIKPTNVLLVRDGQGSIVGAKLTDYGLAQDLIASQRSRSAGQMHPGTATYMSPEQATSQEVLTAASDLYNVGLLLWEMLTGTPRFKQRSKPITSEVLGASEQLTAIVRRALEPDLSRRYEEPADLVRDLDILLTVPKAEPVLPSAPVLANHGRWRRGLIAVALVVLIAVRDSQNPNYPRRVLHSL